MIRLSRHAKILPRWQARPLTARQYEILEFIRDYITNKRYGPSLREIGEHFGFTHVTAHRHLCAIRKKRWVTWTQYEYRSVRLTKPLPKRSKPT